MAVILAMLLMYPPVITAFAVFKEPNTPASITPIFPKIDVPPVLDMLPVKLFANKLPAYRLPVIPAPPKTTNAPVVLFVDTAPDAKTKLP